MFPWFSHDFPIQNGSITTSPPSLEARATAACAWVVGSACPRRASSMASSAAVSWIAAQVVKQCVCVYYIIIFWAEGIISSLVWGILYHHDKNLSPYFGLKELKSLKLKLVH